MRRYAKPCSMHTTNMWHVNNERLYPLDWYPIAQFTKSEPTKTSFKGRYNIKITPNKQQRISWALFVFSVGQISSRHVRFQVFLGVKRVALLDFPQVRVDDGQWHHILVELQSVKDGKDIKYMAKVSLDYGMFQVCTRSSSAREGKVDIKNVNTCCEMQHQICCVCFAEVGGDRQRTARIETEKSLCGRTDEEGWDSHEWPERLHAGGCRSSPCRDNLLAIVLKDLHLIYSTPSGLSLALCA